MGYDFSKLIRTDIKLLSWKSVLSIGLTYLVAVGVTIFISGSLFLLSENIDGTTALEKTMRLICLAMSFSIWIASAIGLTIKIVADSFSAAHFLRKVTDAMFEKNENKMVCSECARKISDL